MKIKTHRDTFEAFLAPDKYEYRHCPFCEFMTDTNDGDCNKCPVEFYCDDSGVAVFPFVWDYIEPGDKVKIIRYVLRNCKNWRRENIERVARKKAIDLGYKFKKRSKCS